MNKKIVVTIGDPAGCGPFITLKAIERMKDEPLEFIVVGDKTVLETMPVFRKVRKRIKLINLNTPGINKLKKGIVNKLAGKASLNYLDKSLKILKDERIPCLVTAPVSKEAVQLNSPEFSGHTEYLSDNFKIKKVAMMMVADSFKVVLLTRHIPLREVPFKITKAGLMNTFKLVYPFLRDKFKIKKPKIAICSLNPHAGVETFLDKEEKVIKSAVLKSSVPVAGPYPPDTLFIKDNLKNYDCVITLYHDQGMIPFKLLSFKKGVNLTIGLPVIRTSPAHGVAFDVIRKNKPLFCSSMVESIRLAFNLGHAIS